MLPAGGFLCLSLIGSFDFPIFFVAFVAVFDLSNKIITKNDKTNMISENCRLNFMLVKALIYLLLSVNDYIRFIYFLFSDLFASFPDAEVLEYIL